MFIPESTFLWDFWFADGGHDLDGKHHLFSLRAPRDPDNPDGRHWVAQVGHATSSDLVTWEDHGIVFGPGELGQWDDLATWTGSIFRHEGRFWFFYTGIDTIHRGRIQRIGLAFSDDLVTWKRHPDNPVLTADPRWYQTWGGPQWDEPFRDPVVVRDEEHGDWKMFFCAKANRGPIDERGVVGCARSTDLLHWECQPPVAGPGEFGQLEVPQPVQVGDQRYLVFCTDQHARKRQADNGPDAGWTGTDYLLGENLDGPWRHHAGPPLDGDVRGTWYAGRIETGLGPQPLYFAWRRLDDAGEFVGGLSNPSPVTRHPDGRLTIDHSALWDE